MKILHIDCSVRNEASLSRTLSASLVKQLVDKRSDDTSVVRLDLANDTPAHPTALFTTAMYTPPPDQTPEMKEELAESNVMIDKMLAAELYVIGMPMYNFSVPSNFKAFVDNVVRVGRTFTKGANGFEGLLHDKKVVVINTRGADYRVDHFKEMDHLVPYIRTIFGFMGITDIEFVNVHPIQFFGEGERQKAIDAANDQLVSLTSRF